MNERKLKDLFLGYATGQTSRRDFIRNALALGVSATAVGSMLEACGSPPPAEPPKPPEPAKPVAPTPPPPPAEPELGEMEKELHIYNWSDYIAEDTVKNFEKESGVKQPRHLLAPVIFLAISSAALAFC